MCFHSLLHRAILWRRLSTSRGSAEALPASHPLYCDFYKINTRYPGLAGIRRRRDLGSVGLSVLGRLLGYRLSREKNLQTRHRRRGKEEIGHWAWEVFDSYSWRVKREIPPRILHPSLTSNEPLEWDPPVRRGGELVKNIFRCESTVGTKENESKGSRGNVGCWWGSELGPWIGVLLRKWSH